VYPEIQLEGVQIYLSKHIWLYYMIINRPTTIKAYDVRFGT